MSLIYDLPVIADIISDVVDSIRETGTIDSVVFNSGVSTVTTNNSLTERDIIVINSIDYKVFGVSSTEYKVNGDVSGQTSWRAYAPYFMDGHLLDISNRLVEMDVSAENFKYKKYPLIVLIQDIKMQKFDGPKVEADLDFRIVDNTEVSYDTKDRREKKFKPILDPLYSKFIKAIDDFIGIDITSEDWEVIRRYYWGSSLNDQNIFADFLDAIEINQIKTQITLTC